MFFAKIGLPAMTASWLVMNEKEEDDDISIPTRELLVSVSNLIALNRNAQALAILCNSYPREPQERFLFGELYFFLLGAVARIKINDLKGAIEDFERAYALSFSGVFETPFVELGKNLHPLVVVALRKEDCNIPDEWLKRVDRKAYIYAKKTAVIRGSYKTEHKIEDNIQLSEREHEVLTDIYHGLTREEIAENQYISLPTVKKTIESIYTKLDANNIADAIRIALKNKLIID
jgi:LuxR family maltose regulon positive regulatory protein